MICTFKRSWNCLHIHYYICGPVPEWRNVQSSLSENDVHAFAQVLSPGFSLLSMSTRPIVLLLSKPRISHPHASPLISNPLHLCNTFCFTPCFRSYASSLITSRTFFDVSLYFTSCFRQLRRQGWSMGAASGPLTIADLCSMCRSCLRWALVAVILEGSKSTQNLLGSATRFRFASRIPHWNHLRIAPTGQHV